MASGSLPGVAGLQAFSDFAFLLPVTPFELTCSIHNVLYQALLTLVERTDRDAENMPIFYIEELPNFGLIYMCFTNAEDSTRHIRSTEVYLHIHLWLDHYAIIVLRASPTGGKGDQGLIEPYTAFSVGFAFGIRTDRRPVRVLCPRELAFSPIDFLEFEIVCLHNIVHLEAPAPPVLQIVPRFPITEGELLSHAWAEEGLGLEPAESAASHQVFG
ncbi:hypothetical protein FISHEDRAFT_75670 [Fistulina hepatica ATCC 64428]|uniref:Uncharacterized protein n=1 Tax=Fistulina hepatica ATCC 64428 TaxID=1128425 RepID=A0A0D7A926_9AGAR|nr:hypothetical protein FISHEDRAFT_75670 [Fistulina hepatica ATCC 64428]